MELTETSFLIYAMNCYDNPSCHEVSEFEEDLKRFQYIRKLLKKYKETGDLRERLILNHIIVIYNLFGYRATEMLYMKMEGFHEYLKPFLEYLRYNSNTISYNGKTLQITKVISDQDITKTLRRI